MSAKKKASSRNFAAAEMSRFNADWMTSGTDRDSAILSNGERLRSRCRDLAKNNPYVRRFLADLASNVIGADGISLKMRVKRSNRGRMAGQIDIEANRIIEEAWKEHCRAKNFEVTRSLNKAEWSRIALKSTATAGEIGIGLIRGFPKNGAKFAVQGIESEHFPYDYHLQQSRNGNRVRASVELDSWGEHVAYMIRKNHPGSVYAYSGTGKEHQWMQSESYREYGGSALGSSMILAFQKEEFGQNRGSSWLATAVRQLRQLGMYEEAAVIGARVGASKMLFVTQDIDAAGSYTGDEEDGEFEEESADGSSIIDVEPGGAGKLNPGESIVSWDPNDPNGNYPTFRKGILRGIAAGLMCNYNTLANDLEGVSFSSIRQGVLAEREIWKMIQNWWIETVESPIFYGWLEMAVLNGELPFNLSDLPRLSCAEFNGRRWDWVDPLKDINAAQKAVAMGADSVQNIARARGRDLNEIAEEQREDSALAKGREGEEQLSFSSLFVAEETAEPTAEGGEEARSQGEEIKERLDSYGVAVRSGSITPQREDEEAFRAEMELPGISENVSGAWDEDGGYRRPITLQGGNVVEAEAAKEEIES